MNENYRSDDGESELKSKWIRLIGVILAALIVVGLLATSVDCDGEEGSGDMQVMELTGRPGLTSFNKAMDLLEGLSEYETGQAEVTILRNLQAWLRDSDPVVEWVADPMVSRLPKKYRMVSNVDLSRKSIGPFRRPGPSRSKLVTRCCSDSATCQRHKSRGSEDLGGYKGRC